MERGKRTSRADEAQAIVANAFAPSKKGSRSTSPKNRDIDVPHFGSLGKRRGLTLQLKRSTDTALAPRCMAAESTSPSASDTNQTGTLRERRGLALKLASEDAPNLTPVADAARFMSDNRVLMPPRRQPPTLSPAVRLLPQQAQPSVQLLPRGFTAGNSERSLPRSRRQNKHATKNLPAAFPQRRTVFFFDWDDTLCPTTWIRSLLKETLADYKDWEQGAEFASGSVINEMDWRDAIPGWFHHPLPDEPAVEMAIEDMQQAAINVLNIAQSFGAVCILTNAVHGWVEKSMKKWLPKLKEYILGNGTMQRPPIRVLYGQEAYIAQQKLEKVPWIDELGEHMWWKKAAMTNALQELQDLYRCEDAADEATPLTARSRGQVLPGTSWCQSTTSRRLSNVISIGDNEAEMQAAQLASHGYDDWGRDRRQGQPKKQTPLEELSESARKERRRRERFGGWNAAVCNADRRHSATGPRYHHWPFVKLVKLREGPHVRGLCHELADVAELLPKLVMLRNHIRVDVGRDGFICDGFPWTSWKSTHLVAELLTAHDVDVSLFGEGMAKSLEQLVAQLEGGAVKLMLDENDRIVRTMDLVVLMVFSRKDGKVLMETGKVFPDGRMRRHVWPPGSRKMPNESTVDVAERLIRDRLLLSESSVLPDMQHEVRQVKLDSVAFPGLTTVYRKEFVRCYLDKEHMSQQALTRIGLPDERPWRAPDTNGNTRFFAWMTEEEALQASDTMRASGEQEDVSSMVLTPVSIWAKEPTVRRRKTSADEASIGPRSPCNKFRPWCKWDLETERHLRVAMV